MTQSDSFIGETVGADVGISSEDRAMGEAMASIINRPKKAKLEDRGPGGWLPKLDLPGFGEEGETCGEDIPHFCDACGDPFPVGRTCSKSMCPRCGASWVMKRAGSSRENSNGSKEDEETKETPGHVAMLDAVSRMKSMDEGGASIKWHHVVFSPPMDSWFLQAQDPLNKTFHVIRDLLELWGAEGYVYYHPWAGDNEDHDGDDRGEWKKRLFSYRDFEGDVRDELIPRGHFHAIVAAEEVPMGDSVTVMHEETGWVIKRVMNRDGTRSIDGLENLARAVTYCLSHTGIDTSGERNHAKFRRYGSTFDRLKHCPKKDEADDWVRSVARETLGVPLADVKCREKVPESEACDTHDHDHTPDGDVDDVEATADEVEDPEDVNYVPCNGKVRSIDEADRYLSNPKWRAQARHADRLQSTFDDWTEGDGWPGG